MNKLTMMVAGLLALAPAMTLACPVDDTDAAATMVKSPGKARAAIDVNYRLVSKPAVGETLQMELTASSRQAATLELLFKVPDGLRSVTPLQPMRVNSGEPLRLSFVPQLEGRFYVTAIVSEPGTRNAVRVISIPVQVGQQAARVSKAVPAANGELLIRMSAD